MPSRTSRPSDRPDIYVRITGDIVASLERGVRPWTKPWRAAHAAGPVSKPLRFSGEPYAGINVLSLWTAAMARGFSAPIWMTFRQAKELGGAVRKGERGSPVVYADTARRHEIDEETGEERERAFGFLKAYTVFNVEQIDGLPPRFHERAAHPVNPDGRVEIAEAFFARIGADIRHGGSAAFYSPTLDRIHLPTFDAFRDAHGYYATLAHEATHWTRHPSRLDRDFGRKRYGDEGYAREELVAELGAAFLSADLGLALEDRDDHAAYIASWLTILRNDKRAVFAAAAHAQRAADFLHGLQKREGA